MEKFIEAIVESKENDVIKLDSKDILIMLKVMASNKEWLASVLETNIESENFEFCQIVHDFIKNNNK